MSNTFLKVLESIEIIDNKAELKVIKQHIINRKYMLMIPKSILSLKKHLCLCKVSKYTMYWCFAGLDFFVKCKNYEVKIGINDYVWNSTRLRNSLKLNNFIALLYWASEQENEINLPKTTKNLEKFILNIRNWTSIKTFAKPFVLDKIIVDIICFLNKKIIDNEILLNKILDQLSVEIDEDFDFLL